MAYYSRVKTVPSQLYFRVRRAQGFEGDSWYQNPNFVIKNCV